MLVEISDKLYKDIFSYCELNKLETGTFIEDLLKKYFMIEKYGEKPNVWHKPETMTTVVEVKEEKPKRTTKPKEKVESKEELDTAPFKELVDVIIENSEKPEETPKPLKRKLN